ncbi:PulJ/GspJ family protein [Bacillus suaedaesalsae]|uniref:Prepilin-type N-terminal cleavage/methylation domain-containing protein n=1 Tax=Bacillus suaedaesalsae TaxID=2810349 RepID=A0ABS2DMM1_9BACI|nr:prepilin-type N-terminal cleavage/methylation domain-containing protein [Bacillus suaedaesalsae]MBM6619760.1 prepilin-type N-terminal cleavage/methylation domain-containing protein [Bacillus suaedaesalsae]
MNNQKGITLIEVLVTLSILVIVSGLVYGVFFQSLTSYEKTQSHALLRQEANVILAELTAAHRKLDTYTLSTDENKAIFLNDENISNNAFSYELNINGQGISNSVRRMKTDQFIDVELTVSVSNDEEQTFTISTIINKVSGGDDVEN